MKVMLAAGLVALGAFIVVLRSGNVKATATPVVVQQPVPDAPQPEPARPEPANPLRDVPLLRRALVPLMPSTTWGPLAGLSEYFGSSELRLPFDTFVPSNIEYQISGPRFDDVREVSIEAFVASPGDVAPAKRRLAEVVNQWFESLGLKAPKALLTSVAKGSNFNATEGQLSIAYEVERGTGNPILQPDGTKYQSLRMTLTVRPI